MRRTLRSIASVGTSPDCTAARSGPSLHHGFGPGIATSCDAFAESTERTPVQSDTTIPSKPHSELSGVSSSSCSDAVTPLTELYDDMIAHACASVTAFSNASRYSSRRARSDTSVDAVKRSVS